ncbi:phiSA1p31-related protein [Streptomyces sp. NPDC047315]|uniref:DNA polymerase III subunit beta family protein n=1 Tax=Streptomyces sp. NPDC047315 TaxID=3155142 RepID=UPI00340EB38A
MTSVSVRDLRRILRQVAPHMGTDDTLPVLAAIRLEAHDGWLYAVATDRYTLAAARTQIVAADDWRAPLPGGELPSVLAWLKHQSTLADTVSLATAGHDGQTSLDLTSSTGHLRVTTTDRNHSRFPDWRDMLRTQLTAERGPVPVTAFTTPYLARWEHAEERLIAWQTSPTKPLLLASEGGDFLGMQMPVSLHGVDHASVAAGWVDCLTRTAVVDGQTYRLDVRWVDRDGDPWEYAGWDLDGKPLMRVSGLDGDEHTLAELIAGFGPIRPSAA